MPEYVRLSTRDYARTEEVDGEVEAVRYRGDIGQSITYSRSMSFWPWGMSSGTLTAGAISIDNRDGWYDQLIFRDMRDQPIRVTMPTTDGTDITVLTAIVDRVEAPNDREVLVHLKDNLTLLDVPLQQQVYDDTADDGVIDRPLPVLLGVARSIRPTIWQADVPGEDGPAIRIHDSTLSGVANVRDRGEQLSPFDVPPAYVLDGRIGNAGLILGAEPDGVLTLDASSSGDAMTPPEAPDALDGDGDFTRPFNTITELDNPNELDGWTFTGWPTTDGLSWETARFEPYMRGGAQVGGRFFGGSTQTGRAYFWSDMPVLKAGKTYRWELDMVTAVSYWSHIGSKGYVALSHARQRVIGRDNPSGKVLFRRQMLDADNRPGVYSGVVTIPEGDDHYVQIGTYKGGAVTIAYLKFIELDVPDVDDLEGITLYDYLVEVVRRAGMTSSVIDKPSVDAVDPNQESIGAYFDAPITALAAARAPLDSFCADIHTDREGQLIAARLRDPALDVPTLTVDRDNITRESEVYVYPDEAKGLTTAMAAGKNWYALRESDFAEDAVTLSERDRLTRDGRYIRTAILPGDEETTGAGGEIAEWPRMYKHAVGAEPLLSLFDDPEAARAEIQRVADIYSQMRQFVEVDIWVEPGEMIELNQVAFFKYPRYGFDDGKNMIVVGVADTISDSGRRRAVSLTLWG